MIAALLTLLATLAEIACHCAPASVVLTPNGLRCSAVRSRSACDDVAGWHTVDGWLAVCSSGCGPNGADDTRTE